MSTTPFFIKKCYPWLIEIENTKEVIEIDFGEDQQLINQLKDETFDATYHEYQPKPKTKKELKTTSRGSVYVRDKKVAINALARAEYVCEYQKEHLVFQRKNKKTTYTEPHHLIPLKYHDMFINSLDVEANIVSLCSHCHNLIHYGHESEKLIEELFLRRIKELKDAGIAQLKDGRELTIDILLYFYM